MAVYVSPEAMEERTLMVIRKYNVLYMKQLLHFFEGEEKAAGKAVSRLLKNRQITEILIPVFLPPMNLRIR